jgi:hypothetical protein
MQKYLYIHIFRYRVSHTEPIFRRDDVRRIFALCADVFVWMDCEMMRLGLHKHLQTDDTLAGTVGKLTSKAPFYCKEL